MKQTNHDLICRLIPLQSWEIAFYPEIKLVNSTTDQKENLLFYSKNMNLKFVIFQKFLFYLVAYDPDIKLKTLLTLRGAGGHTHFFPRILNLLFFSNVSSVGRVYC